MNPKSLVYSAVVLLVAASIAVAAFRHFGLGSVVGLLVAGIFIGPHTPGPSVVSHVEAGVGRAVSDKLSEVRQYPKGNLDSARMLESSEGMCRIRGADLGARLT